MIVGIDIAYNSPPPTPINLLIYTPHHLINSPLLDDVSEKNYLAY